MKYWEIITDNLSKAGWSWGCVAAMDREGQTIWIVDAHRDNGKRFVARADEKLTAFLELEAAVQESTRSRNTARPAGDALWGSSSIHRTRHANVALDFQIAQNIGTSFLTCRF